MLCQHVIQDQFLWWQRPPILSTCTSDYCYLPTGGLSGLKQHRV